MATEAQIKANQENAKKSTGPLTEEGKQRSSMNAMKHGIFSTIPLLPGENLEQFKLLEEEIIKAYQPMDAMECLLVQRLYLTCMRQIRLREAEAAKLEISMMPEVMCKTVTQLFEHNSDKRFTAEDISELTEAHYMFAQALEKEIKESGYASLALTIEMIKEKMPLTSRHMKDIHEEEYKLSWEEFIQKPGMLRAAISMLAKKVKIQLASTKNNHIAYTLKHKLKIVHRIPHGDDMTIFTKYQVQLDTDLYRAMKALQDYRCNKTKVIEGEVINEMAT
ncbi:hypothetical protein FIT74_04375 [Candidatus Methylopumilus universalis]|jgi:hypothetical protein|uniref:Uncharacterized protein n=1 Tax=Candidatus Methylopumilus universalis TaxID=2588536 RepID=A0ABX5VVI1_9PROT|nr:hypothetical protein [Candidatus Methylopumilus universalis]QDC51257.1 hypothetical protein FIT73_04325 [Candidatus Methylopumilus universalis]QDC61395.1 hypothetical protein FIT74_04375 [Candidatus Methylopumilus universalis]